jgi:hypothetical protein
MSEKFGPCIECYRLVREVVLPNLETDPTASTSAPLVEHWRLAHGLFGVQNPHSIMPAVVWLGGEVGAQIRARGY